MGLSGQGNSKNEIYFGHKNADTTYYALLKSEGDYEGSHISIFLTKLEDKLLVVGSDVYDGNKKVLTSTGGLPPVLDFGNIYNQGTKMVFSVYNPYQFSFFIELELKNDNNEDTFSYDSEGPVGEIPIAPRQQFDFIINAKKAGEDNRKGDITISSNSFKEFTMSFIGNKC